MVFFGNFLFTKKESYSCRGTKHPSLRPQALRLFTAARAFPHVTGVFLIVVVPPTVPAQLSAAAARCYGKLFCSLVLRDNKHITPRALRAHLPIAVLRAAMGAI